MTRPYDLWSDPANADVAIARISDTWLKEINADVEMRQVNMVVEVVWGDGTRQRASTKRMESSDRHGANRFVFGVLPAEVPVLNDYDIDNPTSSARGLAFSLPSWFVEPVKRKRNGFPLSGFGEVSLLVDGMRWNSRRVILRGDMSGGVSYGPNRRGQMSNDGRPGRCDSGIVHFELRDPRETADFAFPPFLIDEDRNPGAPDQSIGTPYPIVFGGATTVAPHLGSGEFLAAYGTGWTVLDVFREDVSVGFTALEELDAKGTPITKVGSLTGGPVADNETIKVELVSTTKPLPSIITLIRQAVHRFAPHPKQLINNQLFADAQAKVGSSLPARAYANTRDTFISWVEGGVLPDFPMVAMVWDTGRWGPVVTDFRAATRMQLVAGGYHLRSRLGDGVKETPRTQIFNSFVIRYGYDTVLDEFTKVVSADASTNSLCNMSERISQGPRPHPDIESIHIDEDQTAAEVLSWLIAHRTLPTDYVEYIASVSLFWLLRRGDTVSLTDRDYEWDKVRATVERIEYRHSIVTVGFRVWDNPFRTKRLRD